MSKVTKRISGIKGIGTMWAFEFYEDIKDEIEVKILLHETISNFEKKYSRFYEKSLIHQLNNAKEIKTDDKEFIEVLETGVSLFNHTNGVFNFLTGHIIEDKGYDKEYSFKSSENEGSIEDPNVALNFSDGLVKLSSRSKVDIGGFGKGFLVEIISEKLKELGYKSFLINGGGDIKVTSNNGSPIEILLEHPAKRGHSLGSLNLKNISLAASSPLIRQWKDPNSNRIESHLINTKDLNSENHSCAFVISPNAIYADAYSTTLSVDRETEFKENYPFEYLVIEDERMHYSKAFKRLLRS